MWKLLLLTALTAGCAVPVLAQDGGGEREFSPDQLLRGIVRGIQSENSSAQVGEFVIFPRQRTVVVDVKGTNGKPESVTINRGLDCGPTAGTQVAVLGTLQQGHLQAPVPLPLSRLLSGNYNLIVHNNTPGSAVVACGHIYLR
jgi:hypothetical protein